MKFTLEIDPQTNPNAVGELLRSRFFDTPEGGVGCYSSFEWTKGVEPLPKELVEERRQRNGGGWRGWCDEEFPMYWKRGMLDEIECRWYWDGDGTLEFIFPDGSALTNYDCKKDYRWEYTP